MKKNYTSNLSFLKKILLKKSQGKALFLFFCLFFLNQTTLLSQTTDPFTASGNWTVPAGVMSVTVEIWGAGGGGGGSSTEANGGSGGGSGAYVTKTMAVTAGTNYTFTIGTGGNGGGAAGGDGGNGGDSTINFGGLITSGGGTGGDGNIGFIGTGGTASGGTFTVGNDGVLGAASGGKGGNSPNGGAGGAGGLDVVGSPGGTPGAGGGGGERGNKNRAGGAGAQGEIHFTYVITGSYCASGSTSSTYWISRFLTTGGVLNFNNPSTYSAGGYGNFTGQVVSQVLGSSFNFSTTTSSGTHGINIFVDWNNDTDFADAGEKVYASGGYVSTAAGTITIPGTALVGDRRMRVVANYLNTDPLACGTSTYTETEDYTVRVIAPPACSGTPIAGTTITSPTSGTPSSTYTVSASGFTNATGLTFQWQSNTSGAGWVNQGSASGTYSNFVATAPGTVGITVLWHLIVSCGAQSATSTNGTFTTVNTLLIPTTGNNSVTCGNNIVLYDNGGAGNYANSSSGYTVLNAELGGTISINGNYATESGWDYIRIYNGTGTGGTLLASYSGTGTINYTGTAGQTLTVQFYSDSVTNGTGFSLSVSYSGVCSPACAGTPTGGTITTSPNSAWPTNPYTVIATGYTQATNMQYQWQYSTSATGPWTNAGGLTSSYANYNAIAPASGIVYWHLVVTCTNSSQTTISPNGIFTTMAVSTVVTGCPNVVSGGLGIMPRGTDPPAVNCTAATTCVNLEATYLDLGETTSYIVEPIAFNPPSAWVNLANAVSVNTDDVYSPIINLPFDFCFYGNKYTRCVIGSNGILSFNTALATTGSGYSFSSNIPISGNTVLRENSIFGVFHDIDPGVTPSTKITWELINLPTGCRALVAIWNNVPMFSDNAASLEYTGMMVLYENSNIIEVYVKQKRIDGTWNGGNAIIGIQNATGTVASVPPGRNGLDPDWTATNEAWRFVPNGNSIASIAWYEGATPTGPVIGTAPTLNVCPSATTTYTAEITYTLCDGRTIKQNDQTTATINGAKTWNGSSSTNWNTAANWTPSGVPTSSDCVVIPSAATTPNDAVVTGASFNAVGLNLSVQAVGDLTIGSTNSLTITDKVTVSPTGIFTVKNNASLVQINNIANTGNIKYERTAPGIKGSDYVYWSSPVANQDMGTIYDPLPLIVSGPKYSWNTTATNANTGLGTWQAASGPMNVAKGYIIRGSSNYGMAATNINTTFTGIPNNGNITIKAPRGNMQPANVGAGLAYNTTTYPTLNAWNDNWTLVGNPYPSSISALQFINANTTNLEGNVRLWRHLSTPAAIPSPFYQNFVYNYQSNDYLTWNLLGPTIPTASDVIRSGQGFMVQRKEGASDATGTDVIFNNVMRRDGTTILSNSGFFRNSNTTTIERNRIWLDIVDDTNLSSETTLVGYVDGGTTGWDSTFDATVGITGDIGIYTFTANEKCIIQGRPTPFDVNDIVPLGINVHTNGSYHIALNTVDGLFSGNAQTIYLEDKLLDIVYNLSSAPYSFTSNAGVVNDRFVLRYTDRVLSNNENNYSNEIKVFANNHLNVISTATKIKNIVVYDVLGKTLVDLKNVKQNEISINELRPTSNVLMVKVTLENDAVIIKKVIY